MDTVEDCLVGGRSEGGFDDATESFLGERDLRRGDAERSRVKEGRGGSEGRRGGVVGMGERFEGAGGGGRVMEGAGFGEGMDRNESREGTSGMQLQGKMSRVYRREEDRTYWTLGLGLFEERAVYFEEGLRLRLRERVDCVSARSRERKER